MALLARNNVKLHDAGLYSDDPENLAIALRAEAERSDLIITSRAAAGSETDHLAEAVRLAGGTAEHYHIALKPGKPLLAGTIGNTLYLGLPGNPVAAMVTALLFGRPLINAFQDLPLLRLRANGRSPQSGYLTEPGEGSSPRAASSDMTPKVGGRSSNRAAADPQVCCRSWWRMDSSI